MNQPDRLLILATSRYDGLIMRRELADRFPDTNITTMTSAQTALTELENNCYDTLILELNALNSTRGEAIESFVKLIIEQESMLTICLRPPVDALDQPDISDRLTNNDAAAQLIMLTKDDSYEQQLPDFISSYYTLAVDVVPACSSYQTNRDRANWIDPTNIAGQLAHEINNPLMMITGTAELLLQDSSEISGEVGKRLKIILRSAGRIKSAMTRLKEQEQSLI